MVTERKEAECNASFGNAGMGVRSSDRSLQARQSEAFQWCLYNRTKGMNKETEYFLAYAKIVADYFDGKSNVVQAMGQLLELNSSMIVPPNLQKTNENLLKAFATKDEASSDENSEDAEYEDSYEDSYEEEYEDSYEETDQ